jgi:hypothetical protein
MPDSQAAVQPVPHVQQRQKAKAEGGLNQRALLHPLSGVSAANANIRGWEAGSWETSGQGGGWGLGVRAVAAGPAADGGREREDETTWWCLRGDGAMGTGEAHRDRPPFDHGAGAVWALPQHHRVEK